MVPLADDTPLRNILTIAAVAAIGVGTWFLLWRLVDLLPAKLTERVGRVDEMELRGALVTQQLLAIPSERSASSTSDLG
jgi:hypothetical protein